MKSKKVVKYNVKTGPRKRHRKIIQISTTSPIEGECARLYALCDDGSLWGRFLDNKDPNKWLPVEVEKIEYDK